jgi:ankyrin repeat protein
MLKQKEKLPNVCIPILQAGDLKSLKKYAPALKRHESWIGGGGFSPLHLAARYNQVEICQFLLEEGITPDITEPFTKKTPLHIASYFGHLSVARVLRKFGASLDAEDRIVCRPIHYAAMAKQKDLILFFLENRIEPAVQSIFGNVLDILIRKKSLSLVDFVSNIDGVVALDTYYFSSDTPGRSIDDGEWTPFHSAAVSGQVEIFDMLMRKFPFMPAIKRGLRYARLENSTSPADLALLEGSLSIKKMLQVDQNTDEYRRTFMKKNWYETDFPKRKELCDAIRFRNIEKVKEIVRNRGIDVIFQREKKTRSQKYFVSLEKPNALDFATYVYSLPFFLIFLWKNGLRFLLMSFLLLRGKVICFLIGQSWRCTH